MVVCVAINLLLLGQPGFDPDDLPSPQPPPFSPHVAPPPPFPPGVTYARSRPASLLLTLAGAVILKGRLNAGPLEDDEQAAVAAALIFVAAAPVALGVALALRDLCADRCSPRRRQFAGATTPPTAPSAEASVRTTAHPGEISYTVHANAARV